MNTWMEFKMEISNYFIYCFILLKRACWKRYDTKILWIHIENSNGQSVLNFSHLDKWRFTLGKTSIPLRVGDEQWKKDVFFHLSFWINASIFTVFDMGHCIWWVWKSIVEAFIVEFDLFNFHRLKNSVVEEIYCWKMWNTIFESRFRAKSTIAWAFLTCGLILLVHFQQSFLLNAECSNKAKSCSFN